MKSNSLLHTWLGLLGLLCLLGSAATARATSVTVSTAALVGNGSGPFYLGFQSIYGSGSAQTIAASGFSATGGSFVADTAWSDGAVTGDLFSSVQLSPSMSSVYNEFFQQFSAGVTAITFDLDFTKNPAAGTPTSFIVWVLGGDTYPIPTDGFGDTLLFAEIDGAATRIQIARSTGSTAGVTVSVPETGNTAALALGAMLVFGFVRRQSRKAPAVAT